MLVYHIRACAPLTSEGIYISIVTIHQNSGFGSLETRRQQIRRPENSIFGCPGVFGMAVQAMNQDNVDMRIGGGVYAGYLKALYLRMRLW